MTNVVTTLLTMLSLFSFTECKKSSVPEKAYRIPGKMTVDGRVRTYMLNLPSRYYESQNAMPVVIGLHGTGGSAEQFERDYGFTEKANSSGFITVYAEGVRGDGVLRMRAWNAGTCCDYAQEQHINDVKYIHLQQSMLPISYGFFLRVIRYPDASK